MQLALFLKVQHASCLVMKIRVYKVHYSETLGTHCAIYSKFYMNIARQH